VPKALVVDEGTLDGSSSAPEESIEKAKIPEPEAPKQDRGLPGFFRRLFRR